MVILLAKANAGDHNLGLRLNHGQRPPYRTDTSKLPQLKTERWSSAGMIIIQRRPSNTFWIPYISSQGDLEITFIGHGSLMFTFNGKVIHVDPFSKLAEYSKLSKADMLLITHEHRDHLDLKAMEAIRTTM
jgi:hypothetical protein